MKRRAVLIGVAVVVFVILPVVFYILYLLFWQPKSTESTVVQYTDKDTGEVVDTFTNVVPESDGNSDITILGLVKLNEDTYSRSQFLFIKNAINTYVIENLNKKYKLVALLPESYVNTNGTITALLRLGEEATIPITIVARDTGESRVTISDPENKHGGVFDTGFVFVESD